MTWSVPIHSNIYAINMLEATIAKKFFRDVWIVERGFVQYFSGIHVWQLLVFKFIYSCMLWCLIKMYGSLHLQGRVISLVLQKLYFLPVWWYRKRSIKIFLFVGYYVVKLLVFSKAILNINIIIHILIIEILYSFSSMYHIHFLLHNFLIYCINEIDYIIKIYPRI